MQPNTNDYHEDVISLREQFEIIWPKKNLIAIITSVVTILSIVYAFTKTPVYETRALIEIGDYKTRALIEIGDDKTMNVNIPLDNAASLAQKLNILFIDLLGNEKNRGSKITSILAVKKLTGFVEVKAEAISNKLAEEELLKVFKYIQSEHQNKINLIKQERRQQIASVDEQIATIKNKQIELLAKNNKNLDANQAILNSLQLIEMINGELGVSSISDLIQQKNELVLLLAEYNYKNSEIVGQIIVSGNPIKPKKRLIIIIAFITSFILSILLVFIINAFKPKSKEQTQ